MPKINFDPKNVRGSDTNFPKVALDQDAVWRVVIAEDSPTYEWVHRLEKPKLSAVTGQLEEREVEFRGEKKIVPATIFVGSPMCLGNLDALEDRGVDPDNCPVCAAALSEYADYFSKPERKFAVHVLKYGTKSGGSQVVTPLNLETFVWRMSEKRYGEVVRVIEEFGGDPMQVDLVLGPCTNKQFQNYKIGGAAKCEIAQSADAQKRAQETFEGNNAGDLSPYCGRRADTKFVEADVREIIALWNKAHSGGSSAPEPDFSESLGDSGAALLEGAPVAQEKVAEVSLDDTVGPPAAEPVTEPAAAPAAATSAPAEKGPSFDFGDLIGQLGAKS